MTESRVQRGRKSEVYSVAYWRPVYPDVTGVAAGMGGTDLVNTGHMAAEIKARRRLDFMAWLRQARKNASPDQVPVVIVRMTGQGEAAIDDWLAFTDHWHLRKLVKAYELSMGTGSPRTDPETDQDRPGAGVEQLDNVGYTISGDAALGLHAFLRSMEPYAGDGKVFVRLSKNA